MERNRMKNILVSGTCGQIGSELVVYLNEHFKDIHLISSDIKKPPVFLTRHSQFIYLDVLNFEELNKIVVEQQIDTIFHMAAILSAVGEKNPQQAYRVNMDGLLNVLEAGRIHKIERIITPSSIAAFGPDAPKEKTPDNTVMNPTTMYGVTKVGGEKLIQYYYLKYGLDARSLRYPGIISSETLPGGGTTDFAVDMYLAAVNHQPYICYIDADTPLPFMYMPDAIKAIVELANAPDKYLSQRVYNVHAMSLTPAQIVDSIRNFYPDFKVTYQPDFRQEIAQSWPHSLDDSRARQEWRWNPDFDLTAMTQDMLEKLQKKF